MSKYTTEVRFICEMASGFPVDNMASYSPDQIIEAAIPSVFNFDFPIYEEEHRPVLEKKILKHYYTREIGAETVGLWKLWLNTTLNEIMPKYNRLYEAEQEAYTHALYNIDVYTDMDAGHDSKREDNFLQTENGSTSRNDTGNIRRKYSDTPQGSVTFNQAGQNLWLTDLTETDTTGSEQESRTDSSRNTGSSQTTGADKSRTHEYGYRGGKTAEELMFDYSERVLNIDMMIINDLRDLFMKVW